MIDYLEALLEEETSLEWKETVLTPSVRRDGPPWQEESPSVQAGQDVTAERNLSRFAGWEGEPTANRAGAAELLGLLTRASLTAGQIRQAGRPLTVTLSGENPPARGMDLYDMDRAVQRDARRYDGGFPLY